MICGYFYVLEMTKFYVMTDKVCWNWEDVIRFNFLPVKK